MEFLPQGLHCPGRSEWKGGLVRFRQKLHTWGQEGSGVVVGGGTNSMIAAIQKMAHVVQNRERFKTLVLFRCEAWPSARVSHRTSTLNPEQPPVLVMGLSRTPSHLEDLLESELIRMVALHGVGTKSTRIYAGEYVHFCSRARPRNAWTPLHNPETPLTASPDACRSFPPGGPMLSALAGSPPGLWRWSSSPWVWPSSSSSGGLFPRWCSSQ